MAETPPIAELRDWTYEQWEQLRIAEPYEWVRLRGLLRSERRAEAHYGADELSDLMRYEHADPEAEAQRLLVLQVREEWGDVGAVHGWTSDEAKSALGRYSDAELELRELHLDHLRRWALSPNAPGADGRKPPPAPPAPPPRELTPEERQARREWLEREYQRDRGRSRDGTFSFFNEER